MKNIVEQVILENMALCFDSTSMALELICEDLFYKHGIDAKYKGRSIYVGHNRVASIETCKEGKDIIAIWKYKIIGG